MDIRRYREFASVSLQHGVRLFALESDRYKTVRARIMLLDPIRPATATENALLARVLNQGSELHPSRRDLARACELLYGASLAMDVARLADIQTFSATIDFPADRYLPKGSRELEGALGLLCEVLTRPALSEDGTGLRADVVAQEKYQLEQRLKARQDDKPSWAAFLAARKIYEGTPGAVSDQGEIEDLAAITPQSLLERHRSLLGSARVLAFITGPVREERAIGAMARILKLSQKRRSSLPSPAALAPRKGIARHKVDTETEQSHLVFAWTGAPNYGDTEFPAALVANAIFGGFSMSRLFKVVREEHGLAYAVYSMLQRARGAMFAQAAVAPEQARKAAGLIRGQLGQLQTKGFSAEEFTAARESLIESTRAGLDSLSARAADLAFQTVLGFRRKPEQMLRDLAAVTPAQVRKVFKRLKPHTEFRMG